MHSEYASLHLVCIYVVVCTEDLVHDQHAVYLIHAGAAWPWEELVVGDKYNRHTGIVELGMVARLPDASTCRVAPVVRCEQIKVGALTEVGLHAHRSQGHTYQVPFAAYRRMYALCMRPYSIAFIGVVFFEHP